MPPNTRRTSFNTILVRLKVWFKSAGYSPKPLFQYHTGSIKSGQGERQVYLQNQAFQYHTGSIKRERKYR